MTIRRSLTLAAFLVLVTLAVWIAGRIWWQQWQPSREDYPIQGIAVSARHGSINWNAVRMQHVDFAYVSVVDTQGKRDTQFATNWPAVRKAGLRYGAELDFTLCRPAMDQATLFITTLPRDAAALPPAVRLDFSPDCRSRPPREAVLSELNTLLNVIEAHDGKPALLRLSKAFEQEYGIASGVNRTLWLDRDYFNPGYAERPWVMWTASHDRKLPGIDAPVDWVVVPK